MEFLQKTLLLYLCIGFVIIPFVVIPIAYSVIYYSYGNFQLYMIQSDSIGVQQDEQWFSFESLQADNLNCSAYIQQTNSNGVLGFTSNVNGSMNINTNMNELKVQLNDVLSLAVQTEYSFDFNAGDNVKFVWRISNPLYNFIIGIIGVALFIANPILSYKLSNNAQDKFKFLFILMAIGFVSLGLALTFVYA